MNIFDYLVPLAVGAVFVVLVLLAVGIAAAALIPVDDSRRLIEVLFR